MNNDYSSQDQEIIKTLKDLEALKQEYPPELMAARRASFIKQVAESAQLVHGEQLTVKDQKIVDLLQSLKATKIEYPLELLTKRRSAFAHQVLEAGRVALWKGFGFLVQNRIEYLIKFLRLPTWQLARASLIAVGIAMVAFTGYALYRNMRQAPTPFAFQYGITPAGPVLATITPQEKVICKNGYLPPLCLAKEFDKSQDLTYQGNGVARPAVAKDTILGYGGIHLASYVNDGLYGPGASWVSQSEDSWIKLDLGQTTVIDTVTFGRDRLGKLNDRDPGQFVIAIAASDDIYANGNSSNDEKEYIKIYDSEKAGFDGTISGPETVIAHFGLKKARYIKITFENAGTAIDEVEVFVSKPLPLVSDPTGKPPKEPSFGILSLMPTNTAFPTETPTAVLTDTPLPSDTPTAIPPDTPIPSDTPVPAPSDTPIPTDTPVPVPIDVIPAAVTEAPSYIQASST